MMVHKKSGFLKIRAQSPSLLLVILLAVLMLAACGDNTPTPTANQTPGTGSAAMLDLTNLTATLNGSGSSFAAPAFNIWQPAFSRQAPNILVNYKPLGSGQGRSDFLAGKTDFGASDVQLSAEEVQKSQRNPNDIIQVPLMLAGIVLAFNVEGVNDLNFTPGIVCGIYTGKLTRWNDPKIKAENPAANLPDVPIELIVRSDNSGTTQNFTQYLSAICPEFKDKVGASGLPDWTKLGLQTEAAPQNAGVAGLTANARYTLV